MAAGEEPAAAFERSLLVLFQSGLGCIMGTNNAVEACQLDVVGVRKPDTFPDLTMAVARGAESPEEVSQYGISYAVVTQAELDAMPAAVWVEGRDVAFGIQVHHRRWGDGVVSLKVTIPLSPDVPLADAIVNEVCQKLVLDPPDCGRLEETITEVVLRSAP